MKSAILRAAVNLHLDGFFSVATMRRWLQDCSGVAATMHRRQMDSHISLRSQQQDKKQFLVDISIFHVIDAGTGVQRVVRNVVDRFIKIPPNGYRIRKIVANKKSPYVYLDETDALTEVQVEMYEGDIFFGLDLNPHIAPRHQDQFLAWRISGARIFFFVYDFLPLTHPENFTSRRVSDFRRWARLIASYSEALLCISEVMKGDVENWISENLSLGVSGPSLTVVPIGGKIVDEDVSLKGIPSAEAQAVLNVVAGRTWVLVVGTIEPRKCHDSVLTAFERLWERKLEVNLVFVGRPGWNTVSLQARVLHHKEHGSRFFWLSKATDIDLDRLYRAASGVLLASKAEGFGLPLVEALGYGKPLLVRDIPVFREVAGMHASYFSNDSADVLSSEIEKWIAGFVKKANETGDDVRQMKNNTWDITNQQILEAMGICH